VFIMSDSTFRVAQIDHVELFVSDREAAAAWYARVFGLTPVPGTAHWAADPEGPLMISPDEGSTKLALFRGEAQGTRTTAGYHRVAFRVDGPGFLAFVASLPVLHLREGEAPVRVVDHQTAFSVYFTDPYGNRLEVTTYDHAIVRAQLSQKAGEGTARAES
jgi:catechol 2,3-dioxygenase-like lactoylglutathione lyase family enzyme